MAVGDQSQLLLLKFLEYSFSLFLRFLGIFHNVLAELRLNYWIFSVHEIFKIFQNLQYLVAMNEIIFSIFLKMQNLL